MAFTDKVSVPRTGSIFATASKSILVLCGQDSLEEYEYHILIKMRRALDGRKKGNSMSSFAFSCSVGVTGTTSRKCGPGIPDFDQLLDDRARFHLMQRLACRFSEILRPTLDTAMSPIAS